MATNATALQLRRVPETGFQGAPLVVTVDFGSDQKGVVASLEGWVREFRDRRSTRIQTEAAAGRDRAGPPNDAVKVPLAEMAKQGHPRLLSEVLGPFARLVEKPLTIVLGENQGQKLPAITLDPQGSNPPVLSISERQLPQSPTLEAFPPITIAEMAQRLSRQVSGRDGESRPVEIGGRFAYGWSDIQGMDKADATAVWRSGAEYIRADHIANRPDPVVHVAMDGFNERPKATDKAQALANYYTNSLNSSLGLAETLANMTDRPAIVMATRQEATVVIAAIAAVAPFSARIKDSVLKQDEMRQALEESTTPHQNKHRGIVKRTIDERRQDRVAEARDGFHEHYRELMTEVRKAVAQSFTDLRRMALLPEVDPGRESRYVTETGDRTPTARVSARDMAALASLALTSEIARQREAGGPAPEQADLRKSNAVVDVLRGPNYVRFRAGQEVLDVSSRNLAGTSFHDLPRGRLGTLRAVTVLDTVHPQGWTVKVPPTGRTSEADAIQVVPGAGGRDQGGKEGTRGSPDAPEMKIHLKRGEMELTDPERARTNARANER